MLESPLGEQVELSALLGNQEVGFEQYRANKAYPILAFQEGRIVFRTWPSGTRWQDTRQFPYDEPPQLGFYTLNEGRATLLGKDQWFAAFGQRPVTTAEGLYSDLYIGTEGLTGIVMNMNAEHLYTLTQWQNRDAKNVQLSQWKDGVALWYFCYTLPESENELYSAAYMVTEDGVAQSIFDTGEQPFDDGFFRWLAWGRMDRRCW